MTATKQRHALVQSSIWLLVVISLFMSCVQELQAAVLPDERVDLLYHRYDGGGAEIDGPSFLVQKNLGDSLSVGLNHYVDSVTSASVDVLVSASEYTEERTENAVSIDYLRQKTTMSLGYTVSDESDFEAKTLSLGISQDMFGDLTTVTMSFALGDNTVGRNEDDTFEEDTKVRSYRLGISQILTKNLVMALTLETITDDGYLNNPYRSVRYLDETSGSGYSFEQEVYPDTRTSNAIALRANYYLPQRAALHGGVRIFEDTWDIDATTYELGYTFPYGDAWIIEASFRYHDQSNAEFYSDLFPSKGALNYLARDKELSTFNSTTLGLGASYEFGRSWSAIGRGSVNLQLDFISFDYDDFRDLTKAGTVGNEPLYSFDATVTRLFTSIWF